MLPENSLILLNHSANFYEFFVINEHKKEKFNTDNMRTCIFNLEQLKKNYKRKKQCITVFTHNLSLFWDYLQSIQGISFKYKKFEHKHKIFSLKISFKKTNNVLLKDFNNFIQLDSNKEYDSSYKFSLLLILFFKMKTEFDINISKSRI